MGCSLAFYLSRSGRRVVVIDRGRIGQGATAACAGGIRAQFSTEINIRMGMEAKRLLARFVEETGQTADFRPVGYLFLLTTDDERSRFRAAIELQRACGRHARAAAADRPLAPAGLRQRTLHRHSSGQSDDD